jgi:hypothetical protein
MTNKVLSGDCLNCESQYSVEFMEEEVSQDLPEYCPFCGSEIEELTEECVEEDDDDLDTRDWD